jgi:CRISPR-associated protein Cas1
MHVVEVAQSSALVRIADGCLAVSSDGCLLGKVPVAEVGILLLSSPHATCSVTALATMAAQGTPVVVCDASHRPAGMMLPFHPHHEIAARIVAQAKASAPLRKRLWKALVQSKIAGQAVVLTEMRGSDYGLKRAVQRVRSGDPGNVEGQAARRYWSKLFGASFRRRRGEGFANKMLDYSYAVLRAAVTRGICTAGLHPSLGIHHHNRSNAFAFSDDLIEPFRPAVDCLVVQSFREFGQLQDLTPAVKRRLVACLETPLPMEGEMRTVTHAIGRSASSLAGVLLGERDQLTLPWIG